jgi:hypothetical protein
MLQLSQGVANHAKTDNGGTIMDDKQFEILITAINNLATAITGIGDKISSSDTLEKAIIKISDVIELK